MAVVSLPAGVFNPYSGVKTSILLLDKALARRADKDRVFQGEKRRFRLGSADGSPIDKNELAAGVGCDRRIHCSGLREGDAGRDVQSVPTALAAESRAEVWDGRLA